MAHRTLDYMRLDTVVPAQRNPKQHTIDGIRASIDRFGFVEPVVLDERTGRLIAGHGRMETLAAAETAGIDPPDGIVRGDDGRWMVPVVRGWASADDREAEAMLVASNRLTEKGGWNSAGLADLLADLAESTAGLTGTGYDQPDLADLLTSLGREVPVAAHQRRLAGPEDDDAPPVPEAPTTRPGDVWLLGPHRLVCGDATTDKAWEILLADGAVADLVWTDPPYGVDYVGKTGSAMTIENDGAAGLRVLLAESLQRTADACRQGAVWWVAAPMGPQLLDFGAVLTDLGVWRQTLIWSKDAFVLGRGDYHWRHEALLYGFVPYDERHEHLLFGWKPGAAHHRPPDRTQDTVWEFPRPRANLIHPTMKPVALIQRAIDNHSDEGDLVIDPFGGSGSTLIAADMSLRVARLIELSPGYCDVICRRYQEYSDVTPILEETGAEHNFAVST